MSKKNAVKGQLISMHICFDMIESDFNIKLRKQDVYHMDGKKVNVNKKTGELIIK